jgi:hypothetical protein
VKVSKPLLRDGDGLRQQVGVALDLALLAEQAGSCPGVDIIGEPVPNKSRRNKMPGGEPPRDIVQMQKYVFFKFCWDNGVENAS